MIKKVLNKESITVLGFTLVSMVGSLIVMKLLSTYLTKENFGIYSLLMSIIAFISIFPFKGLDQATSRYVSINHHENTFKEFYSNYLLLFFVIIVLYSFVFFIISILNISFGIFTEYLWLIFWLLISEVIKITFRTIVGADRKRAELLISNNLEFGIKILVLLVLSDAITIKNLFLLFILANMISSVKLFLENKNELKLNVINKVNFLFHNKRLWLFAYPFIIMAIFGWLRDLSSRWIIDIYLDKESVAAYTVLTTIAFIIPMGMQTILGSYIVPIIYQKENQQKGFAKKITNILLLVLPILFSLIAVFIYIFSHEVITIFSSSKYIYNNWILTSLFLSYSVYTVAMFSVYEILAQQKSKLLILPTIFSAIMTVGSSIILINYYGLTGAFIGCELGYITYSLLIYITIKKYQKL